MAIIRTVLALAAAQAVNAHYGLLYPEWRADTLNAEDDSELSQWTYPCMLDTMFIFCSRPYPNDTAIQALALSSATGTLQTGPSMAAPCPWSWATIGHISS